MERDSEYPIDQSVGVTQYTRMHDYRISIRRFVKDMWGLEPQPVLPEYKEQWEEVCRASGDHWENLKKTVSGHWFGAPLDKERPDLEWRWYAFEKGKHYTWQQNLILMGIEKAIAGDAKRLLSIVSGHGIGKSATCSWVILWFLYCYAESQVPVTAPTSHQMHDVLWKELSIWIKRMPEDDQEIYDWTSDYVRVLYSPESWFARARTSTKENTEAIAGVHAEHVCIVGDEASGIPQQVFDTAEGALTSGNVFVLLISNGTQPTGYFYDTQHSARADWQNFSFNGEESPIVDRAFIALKAKHGFDSDEYKIRVKGGFPGESMMDMSGYLQLLTENKIIVRPRGFAFLGRKILGVDPAGEGKDECTFVLRDRFKAELIHKIRTTNDKLIAEAIITFIDRYSLDPKDVVVGAFGTGADVGKEVAIATAKERSGPYEIYTVMEGNAPQKEERYNGHLFERFDDELINPEGKPEALEDLYLNLRALMYFRARKWIIAGGQLVDDAETVDKSKFAQELLVIRYKRTLHGNKIQLMSKKEMIKLGIRSPNIGDAFALTFLREMRDPSGQTKEEEERIKEERSRMTAEERHNAL